MSVDLLRKLILIFQFENFQYSQYNGDFVPGTFNWETATTFKPFSDDAFREPMSINYQNGKVVSVSVPASYNAMQKNLMKAWASNWQISLETRQDRSFSTQEVRKVTWKARS